MGILSTISDLFSGGRLSALEQTVAEQRTALVAQLAARWDAAQTSPLNANHWGASVDQWDANSSARPETRRILRNRARAEAQNNGWLAGIQDRLANDVVGTGPRLILNCGPGVDQRKVSIIEDRVHEHMLRMDFPGKLRTARKSYVVDGDVFGLFQMNPGLFGPDEVQLDWVLRETDQFLELYIRNEPEVVNGIRYDAFGNPLEYFLLDQHPGSTWNIGGSFKGEWIPAKRITHWAHVTRPGLQRGVPEVASVLELFAILRRFTMATLSAAEFAASMAAILKTTMPASGLGAQQPTWGTVPIVRGMAMSAPEGWEPVQMKAEHPTSTFSEFERRILSQIGSALDMPYVVACMDASQSNYSSMRGDRIAYQRKIESNQAAIERRILDPFLNYWLDEAALASGIIPYGLPVRDRWTWEWAWDGTSHIDPLKEATAEQIALAGNSTTLAEVCSRRALDWRKVLTQKAAEKAFAESLGLDLQAVTQAAASAGIGLLASIDRNEKGAN
jgi:capsid protein